MADTKLSALTELAATPASDDEVYIRDVSEATPSESKRITITNLMAAAGSIWEEIGDYTVPGAVATISFTSIPSGYAVLQLIWDNLQGDHTDAKDIQLTFNGDAVAANYHFRDSIAAIGNDTIPFWKAVGDSDADDRHASGHFFINNTAGNMTTYHGIYVEWNASGTFNTHGYLSGNWITTDEITTVTLTPTGGNFDAGRVILLGLVT